MIIIPKHTLTNFYGSAEILNNLKNNLDEIEVNLTNNDLYLKNTLKDKLFKSQEYIKKKLEEFKLTQEFTIDFSTNSNFPGIHMT